MCNQRVECGCWIWSVGNEEPVGVSCLIQSLIYQEPNRKSNKEQKNERCFHDTLINNIDEDLLIKHYEIRENNKNNRFMFYDEFIIVDIGFC